MNSKNKPDDISQKTSIEQASLSVINVSHSYGGSLVLKQLSLDLMPKEALAVVGPNGVGKTTLLRIVSGALKPNDGQVYIFGFDVAKNRVYTNSLFGYVSDSPFFYQRLTGSEHIRLWASIYKGSEKTVIEVLEFLEFDSSFLDQLVTQYSQGTKKKLSIALAFCHDPKLLILDEPFSFLDSSAQKKAIQLCQNYITKGGSLIFVTHDNSEVEAVASSVVRLKNGYLEGLA